MHFHVSPTNLISITIWFNYQHMNILFSSVTAKMCVKNTLTAPLIPNISIHTAKLSHACTKQKIKSICHVLDYTVLTSLQIHSSHTLPCVSKQTWCSYMPMQPNMC